MSKPLRILGIIVIAVLVVSVTVWYLQPDSEPAAPQTVAVTDDGQDVYPVVIVGAGAAGLTAGKQLDDAGIDYIIIEASDVYGGRMKEASTFVDLPLDLGAEWIHEDPEVLELISSNPDIGDEVEVITYDPRQGYWFDGVELSDESQELAGYSEHKFKDTTWFGFFDTHVVPSVQDHIVYNRAVSRIDYSGQHVNITTVNGQDYSAAETYLANQIIVAVPVRVLQNQYIEFNPPVSAEQTAAWQRIEFSPGLKAFIEFDQKFYPQILEMGEYNPDRDLDQYIFYDAMFGKQSDRHVMGVLIVGDPALEYIELSDQAITQRLLANLDQAYDGAASRHYRQSVVQNWSQEPHIGGAYSNYTSGPYARTLRTAWQPIDNRVFFAGAEYDLAKQSTVPGAARSAIRAVGEILE